MSRANLASRRASASESEVITVMNPISRPLHLRLAALVSDGDLDARIGPFSIDVTMDNSAPTISGSPSDTIGVGERYSFTPSARDPNGDTLRFEISGKPDWADFNSVTGRLSGTPSDRDLGSHQGIQISATDGNLRASLPVFSIEVVAAGASTGSVALRWTWRRTKWYMLV